MPLWIKDKLFQNLRLSGAQVSIGRKVNWNERLLFAEHHLSHAASAYYPSPFDSAAVLTLDGVENGRQHPLLLVRVAIWILKEIHFPHSLGLLYSAFTFYTGFKVNSGEYKVMGLAPYKPRYVDLIKDNLIDISDDGSFQLDMTYFDYATGLTMTNKKFIHFLGSSP